MYFKEFNIDKPSDSDAISSWALVIQNIKQALKDQFINFNVSAPVTTTLEQFNELENTLKATAIRLDLGDSYKDGPNNQYLASETSTKRLYYSEESDNVLFNMGNLPPIGTIIYSMLTLTQLNNLYANSFYPDVANGNIWAQADGSAIPLSSVYATLTSRGTTPQCTNRFFKMPVDEANLIDLGEDSTDLTDYFVENIILGSDIDLALSNNGGAGMGAHNHNFKDAFGDNIILGRGNSPNGQPLSVSMISTTSTESSSYDGWHHHTIDRNVVKVDFRFQNTGTDETAPKHSKMRAFIRIN